jgi:hypothetical protein
MCLSRERAVDGLQWDALAPCLRPASVDVLISDLPFGKRSGSKADNRVLYPATLLAMARLVRPTTGIELGYLKYCIFKAVLRIHDIFVWIQIRIRGFMPLTNGSGCGPGSFYFEYFHH